DGNALRSVQSAYQGTCDLYAGPGRAVPEAFWQQKALGGSLPGPPHAATAVRDAVTYGRPALCTPVASLPSTNAELFTAAGDSGRVPGARAGGAPAASVADVGACARLDHRLPGMRPPGKDGAQAARAALPGGLPHVPRPLHDGLPQGSAAHALLEGHGGHLPHRGWYLHLHLRRRQSVPDRQA